ncbi:hypothetical protein PITC_055250 [Penicillium italicum]|uniref:Uncharacterized protein n=1 Tax=Penicillium italicum TaxID=40296 RepID=A0A0A2LLS1_PENIT|nr:hypothetical protein PITC_055250 [Penicillium italicum]
MANRTRRSTIHDSSDLSSDDDTPGFANESTGTNNTARSRSSWFPSQATLEILQAHLEADADSDSSEASGPRVHPDFFVYLERLRMINETNRVNARREVEAWYQTAFGSNQSQPQAPRMANSQYHASDMLDESQHEASRMLEESYRGGSQFTNEFNQPPYHASGEHGLQPSAMGVREQYETQDSTAAGPFETMPHVRFEAPNAEDPAHPRDNSPHHRPPSPYPPTARDQSSAVPNPEGTHPMPAPQPQRYTDWGNPYRFPFDPAPFPEGATPYAPERILQAWLIRQQLIAGIRPENIQPMAVPRGRQHRTPPYIVLNESGAHIIRIEPATFEGAMLPLPTLPWLPRRVNPSAPTAPVSSNMPDALGSSTAPNITTAPNTVTAPSSASSLNSSVTPNLSATTNPPVSSHLPAVATLQDALTPPAPSTLPVDPSSAGTLNSSVAPDLSAAPNSSTTNSPLGSHLQAPATLLDYTVVLDPTSVPGGSSQHVAESQNPDPPSVSDLHPERPNMSEPGSNENIQAPVIALQPELQASVPLTVQNRTDADSISSQEVHGVGVSPAHSQDQESSTVSPLSNEGTEMGNFTPPRAPNGDGVVHHTITLPEPEDPDESSVSHLRRFAIDGADESLGVGRLSGEVKAISDQSSLEGLI